MRCAALGWLLVSSPFPPGTARINAQTCFGGFVNLALMPTPTNAHIQYLLATSPSWCLGSRVLGLKIFITSFWLSFKAAKHLWTSKFLTMSGQRPPLWCDGSCSCGAWWQRGWASVGRLLGQSCGIRSAVDVKEEEKMAHGDKLPGNFYGASYSSLSRQLQRC